MKKRSRIALIAVAVAVSVHTAAAEGRESWGCKVLLCAASSAPSWQDVSYCVPPMVRLVRRLARGGNWPSCPGGNATLGYEPFAPCRQGYRAVVRYETYGADDGQRRAVHMCQSSERVERCYTDPNYRDGDAGSRNGRICYTDYRRYHRGPNANPYHYDIPNERGVVERHSFNLEW